MHHTDPQSLRCEQRQSPAGVMRDTGGIPHVDRRLRQGAAGLHPPHAGT
ncbi:hypothetical protein M8494_36220 [Serratia ureilytica]